MEKVYKALPTRTLTSTTSALALALFLGVGVPTPVKAQLVDAETVTVEEIDGHVGVSDPAIYNDRMKRLDPLEPINRGIFAVNSLLDTLFIRPLAFAYRDIVPNVAQDRVSNFLTNLGTPVVFLNDVLQGEIRQSLHTLARFLINSTFGFLGLFDVAGRAGLHGKNNDFDATFRKWGIAAGPYIVLPLFGPSSLRNVVGDVAEYYVDPYNWYMRNTSHSRFLNQDGGGPIVARQAIEGMVERSKVLSITEKLDKMEDPYAQYRILYLQNRKIINAIEESAVPDDIIPAQ